MATLADGTACTPITTAVVLHLIIHCNNVPEVTMPTATFLAIQIEWLVWPAIHLLEVSVCISILGSSCNVNNWSAHCH